ncbi:DNA-3-methyladenine glycosylase [Acidipila sp. EB88]|uniref:DNA-3-methyladenine glycosylase family protein n=1 Tax=Acidipila sp. EB88 TaxID=2305226 RepID=UPI000F5D7D20|nr:AlkA N-terminal domain-containing protein [Acidipila sp. EB88]RRA49274.1 hypothetical protein D1Y84_14320 [Acidipila sp. EB88]
MLKTVTVYPPYDWESCLSFFRHHSLPGLEAVDDLGYERVLETANGLGWFRVDHSAKDNGLRLSLWNGTEVELASIIARVRQMFDLDVSPAYLDVHMQRSRPLSVIWKRNPGIRLARTWSGFETVFAAVLGQVVSVNFGKILIEELMTLAGRRVVHPKTAERIYLFPSAREIANSNLSGIRTSAKRRSTLSVLAAAIDQGTLVLEANADTVGLKRALRNIGGIGVWTAEYAALRGFGDDDAFPSTDYVLKQELTRNKDLEISALRPLRGYAAVALWRHYALRRRL